MNKLPPLAADIQSIIGMDAMLALVEHYGGCSMYIPYTRGDAGSRLESIIGREALVKIIREYGGRHIQVPRLNSYFTAKRNAKIVEMRARGATIREIAQEHGITMRQVFNILMEAKNGHS